MFQCRERQRGCANTNIGWQTLCGSRQTWDLLPPATKVENTKWWWWYKYKITPTQRHRNGQHWAPLLTIWAASKTKTKIWSSFVAFFISSLLILPFQVECTYVLLSSIRVNVFHFHVACNHCSPICFIDHTCDTVIVVKHQPRDLLSCNMVKHLLTTGISVLPHLGISNLPILIDFIKENKKLGPLDKKKTEMICLAIGQSQPGIFYLQKNYDFQKNTHFFTFYKKRKTTSFTQRGGTQL